MEPLTGTGPAPVSSIAGGEVRESTLRRTSLIVAGSPVGFMDTLTAMGPVVLSSDIVTCDSIPRPTSFKVSTFVGWVDPLAGMGAATSVSSDVGRGLFVTPHLV